MISIQNVLYINELISTFNIHLDEVYKIYKIYMYILKYIQYIYKIYVYIYKYIYMYNIVMY